MPVLELQNITKRFGSLAANDAISLSLEAGEILALLGENGAGKTTLMNILFGHYVADEGRILIDGTPLAPGSTDAAIGAGIGMVHQHFTLADNLTVLENIMLGTEPLWAWRQNTRAARKKLNAMSERYGLAIDPSRRVADLSVGERQRTEILKVLYRDARVLILDEPTAVLTPQEADSLFATLRALAKGGLAVIFISHKLHEILAISDRVAVLRRGAIAGEVATKDASRALLAEMMVGRKVVRPRLTAMPPGETVLSLNTITIAPKGANRLLDNVSLDVRAHEIVGIAGVAGNGQKPLADLLCGLARPTSGTMQLFGEDTSRAGPAALVAKGVGRIPEDRHASGIIADMDIWENLISESLRAPGTTRARMFVNKARAIGRAHGMIERFDVRCKGPGAQIGLLSGGNIQKLILARALTGGPPFILASQPVRGLDEGAIAYVHTRLLEARKAGAAIVLISEDLDELMTMCDAIVVMYHGTMSAPFSPAEKSAPEIGLMMAGQHESEPAHAD